MIISHEKKFLFIHVHRTGGSTLTNILKKNLAGRHDFRTQHSNAATLSSEFFRQKKSYFTFAFTRNPWARILSWYSLIHKLEPIDLDGEKARFEAFLESDVAIDATIPFFHYNTLDYISDKNGKLLTDKIFYYEDYEQEMGRLIDQLGFPSVDLPLLNQTSSKDYQDYYSDKSRKLLAKKCHKDIAYFKYKF